MSLEEMQEQVERYYIEMENELLMNIAKKLIQNKPMEIDKYDLEKKQPILGSGGVNEWQLERLKELNGLTKENARTIAKYSGKTIEEIEKIFERAAEIGTEIDQDMLEMGVKVGILNEVNPYNEKQIVKNIIKSAIKETLTTFNEANGSLLVSSNKNYEKIVNKVSTEVMSGTKTFQKAMEEAVSDLAQKGLTSFTARNGAEWHSDSYIKMVLRTNSRNATNKIQEDRMKLYGNDYVEISSHLGARPLCSHDQGKIFSLSGNTTPIEDLNGNLIPVYDWNKSSYGEPAGILGINCGHSRYAFIPNLSIHREKQLDKEENDELYKITQQQRLYERTIRNKTREINLLNTIGAEKTYINNKKEQLKNYKQHFNEFIEEKGLTKRVNTIVIQNATQKQQNKIISEYQKNH